MAAELVAKRGIAQFWQGGKAFADAALIAASRDAVPALLDRLEAAEADNERLRAALRSFAGMVPESDCSEPFDDGEVWIPDAEMTLGMFRDAYSALAPVAQRTERPDPTGEVAGSTPAGVASGWRLIETAPRGGTHFLAYESDGSMYRAAFTDLGQIATFCGQPCCYVPEPTHWRPLPEPPA